MPSTRTPPHGESAPPPDERLTCHLRSWLGCWPPSDPLTIVGSVRRERPSWDGSIRPVVGIETTEGTVLSVARDRVDAVRGLGADVDAVGRGLAAAVGHPTWRFGRGIFRWTAQPTESDDPGIWLPTEDPRVLPWLHPFHGRVLVGLAADGRTPLAGVGRKKHDRFGHELAVVTEPVARGEGWARRLVCQAARRVLAEGAIPTYIHAEDNVASARTAEASGFPDRGWRVLGLFPG